MRACFLLLLTLTLTLIGCSKDDRQRSTSVMSAGAKSQGPSGLANTTASDQLENEADRNITAQVRQAVVKDDSLSTSAHNITIVTKNGNVILRGQVKDQSEKEKIAAKAKQIAGVSNVDNQLTMTN